MTITLDTTPAPSTPLNLQLGVIYTPRIETPPFVAFAATEPRPDRFLVVGFEANGRSAVMFDGSLVDAFFRLATHLRMDVPA